MNTSLFNLTNFYIFLIEFGFSILFLIIFCSIHYGITNSIKLGIRLQKSKWFNFVYFFGFGFLLALITFLVSQVSSIAFGAIGMPLTIIGLIYAMTIFYNRSVQVGALLPTILWVLYQYNGFTEYNFDWLIRVIVVLIIAIIAIATTFIKWKKWPTLLLSCLVTLICLIVLILSMINEYTGFYCVNVIVAIAATIFYYAVIGAINRWLTHVSKISKQGAYIDKYYLIPNVLEEYFDNFVKENKISQALVVSFDLIGPDKFKTKTLENIYLSFKNDKAMFFKSKYDTYGVVLANPEYYITNLNQSYLGNKTTIRDENDQLKTLEQKLSVLNNSKVTINAYVSIYGVHSCNFDGLLKRNQYLYKHTDFDLDHNVVQLFNTNITNQETLDDIAYATLSQKVNLNDINVELELIQMNKSKQIYVCPRFYYPKKLTCDVNEIVNQYGVSIANTLLRNLAVKSLEQYVNKEEYKQYPILIYYPIDQINSNIWSSASFIKKINLYGIDKSNVILSFNAAKYEVWPKQVINNLFDLEKHDINYFLVDVVNIRDLKGLHPKGIILGKDLANRKPTHTLAKKYKLNIL